MINSNDKFLSKFVGPDLWIITIKKLCPFMQKRRKLSKHKKRNLLDHPLIQSCCIPKCEILVKDWRRTRNLMAFQLCGHQMKTIFINREQGLTQTLPHLSLSFIYFTKNYKYLKSLHLRHSQCYSVVLQTIIEFY